MKNLKWKKMTACVMTAALFGSAVTACSSDTDSKNDTSSKGNGDKDEEVKSQAASVGVGSGLAEKDETVYVVTDKSGKTTNITVSEWLKNKGAYESLDDRTNLSGIVNVKGDESFILSGNELTFAAAGSDIYYQGTLDASTKLPVELKITYTLDGREISADDIVGKTGKLVMKIRYIPNEKTEKDIYVPFLAASGVLLSTDKCTNVEVINGKVISNGNSNIIVGVGFPGLSESLGLEEEDVESIPDTVEIAADVKDFDIDMMMTFVSNEIFSDLDFDDVESLSDLDEQIASLSDASTQLKAGVKTLREGIEALNSGSSALSDGVTQLDEGAEALAQGLDTALSGSRQLLSGSTELENGLQKLMAAFVGDSGAISGVSQLDSGAAALSAGVSQLAEGLNSTFSQIGASQQGAAKNYSDYMKSTGLSTANVESDTEIQSQLTQYIGSYAMRCIAVNNEILTTKQEEVKQQKTAEAMAENADLVNSIKQRVVAENQALVTQKVQSQVMEENADYIDSIKQRIAEKYMALYPGQDVTDMVTRDVLEEAASAYGKVITEKVTEELTEMVEEEVTEALTPQVTEAVTQELTAMVTQAVTNDTVLKEYNTKIAALVQAAGQKGAYTALKTISDGAASQDLSGNLNKLVSGAGELAGGIQRFRGVLGKEGDTSTDTIFGALYNLSQGSSKLHTGICSLDEGVGQLESGSNALEEGTGSLKSKVPELLSGMEQLLDGSRTLEDGMNEFDEEGIQKIADLYNGDVKEFMEKVKSVVEAGKEYNTFTKLADEQEGTVKFVITTK